MKTIHIITIHYKSSRWVDLQLNKINKYFNNHKVWTFYNQVDMTNHAHKFHFCKQGHVRSRGVSMEGIPRRSFNHWTKLNNLTNLIIDDENTHEDDILVWMDCDAFPIKNINDFIEERLKSYPVFAVNCPEKNGSIIPHPAFACSTVKFWGKHKLSWEGIRFGPLGPGTSDTGGFLYKFLKEKSIDWYGLRLTHTLTPHQFYFAIYDELIYHHGAGTRSKRRSCGIQFDEQKIFNNIAGDNFNFLGGHTNEIKN